MYCIYSHIRRIFKERFSCPNLGVVLYAHNTYKYLGYYIDEHLSFKKTVNTLTSSASRSFGRVVNLFKKMKNLGFKTYQTLYQSYVTPIMNYSSAIWGFGEQHEPQVLQNRVSRFYLEVNRYTAVAATSTELDWLDPKFQRWLEIVRYKKRLANMEPDCQLESTSGKNH